MFSLDIPTLQFASAVLVSSASLTIFLFWVFNHRIKGTGFWVVGTIFYSIAYLLVFIRVLTDYPIMYLYMLLGSCLVVSALFFLHGIRLSSKRSSLLYYEIFTAIAYTLFSYYFIFITPDTVIRGIGTSLVSGLVSALMAFTLMPVTKWKWKTAQSCTAFLFGSYAIYNFLIAAYLATAAPINFEYLALAFQCASPFILAITMSFMFLAYSLLKTESEKKILDSGRRLKNEQRWVQALEITSAGAWDWNLETHEINFSPRWKKALGFSGDDESVIPEEQIHPEDLITIRKDMEDFVASEQAVFENEHRLLTKQKEWMWVLSRGRLLDSEDETKPTRIIGANVDITQRKHDEERLQKAIETADLANQAKTTFLSNMSHEIRTPMNAILGFSELLQSDPYTSKSQQESLAIINNSGEHLLALIDDILDWSRIESGKAEAQESECSPKDLFQNISAAFNSRENKNRVEFQLQLSQELPVSINADAMRMRQICTNLLGNAFKFTDAGSVVLKVEVEDLQEQQCVLVIQVIDTGTGIAEKDAELIFSVFGQAENGVQAAHGSGLGLFISKNMVALMGGSLEFSSELGQGSCFTLKLPVVISNMAEAVDSGLDAESFIVPIKPGSRVLIIDDIESNRLLLKHILNDLELEIKDANRALEGIELVETFQPDLVLMDVRMPGMSGDQAIVEIRRNPKHKNLPIIAITANALEGEKERLIELGANDYISKPFSKQELFEKIGKLLS